MENHENGYEEPNVSYVKLSQVGAAFSRQDQQDDMYSFPITEPRTKKSHTRATCVAICVILCGLFFLAGYLLAHYTTSSKGKSNHQPGTNTTCDIIGYGKSSMIGNVSSKDGVLPTCIITGISVGYESDEYHLRNRSRIEIVTEANETRLVRFRNRGIIVLKVNSSICQPVEISFFDTYDLDYMSDLFIHYIGDIKDGDYIILLTCDEFTEHLSDDARNLLWNISNGTVIFDFRATLVVAFVKQSASSFCTIDVDAKSASMEPARITVNSTAIQGCQTM